MVFPLTWRAVALHLASLQTCCVEGIPTMFSTVATTTVVEQPALYLALDLVDADECDNAYANIPGNFRVHKSVFSVLPPGIQVQEAARSGVSAWAKTARLSAILKDGTEKKYFLKCITGQGARALVEGEYHSAVTINQACPGLVPEPYGWGQYNIGRDETCYFYVCAFHHMRFNEAPDRRVFADAIAAMHKNGKSPTGMFGYPVKTVIGKMERTVTWEESWAACFTNLLRDVIAYDNETNGVWPELEAACNQLIDVVIPRLLGALQSDGRGITPALVHGDLWENNVGCDTSTGKIVVFDPGCMYAHNEMEFGTWRCRWTTYFRDPKFMQYYKRGYTPSDPKEEWDDRSRLYSIHPYLTDSAGHRGSISRETAYNDILFLCEKYGPLESLEKYDAKKDVLLNCDYAPFEIKQLE